MDLSQPAYNRQTVEEIQQTTTVCYQPMELKLKKRRVRDSKQQSPMNLKTKNPTRSGDNKF